ncbi:MAG: hypothetical protein V1770_03655 [bacterium]
MSKIIVICEEAKKGECKAPNMMCSHRDEHPISKDCFDQSPICFERPNCPDNPIQKQENTGELSDDDIEVMKRKFKNSRMFGEK